MNVIVYLLYVYICTNLLYGCSIFQEYNYCNLDEMDQTLNTVAYLPVGNCRTSLELLHCGSNCLRDNYMFLTPVSNINLTKYPL